MSRVEQTLKDIIEFGFAENVEEELLEFDEQGNLVNVKSGGRTVQHDKTGYSMAESKSREPSAVSESAIQEDSSDGDSSILTKSANKLYLGSAGQSDHGILP